MAVHFEPSERYSPPQLRYGVQRGVALTGALLGLAAVVWGDRLKQLSRFGDWQRLAIVGGPFLLCTAGLQFWRPKREIPVPEGYVLELREGEAGEKKGTLASRAAHNAAYGFTRPWGKGLLYQAFMPCHTPDKNYRQAREEVAKLFGFEFVKYESFQERGAEETMLLDGIRMRADGFRAHMNGLAAKSEEELEAFVAEKVERGIVRTHTLKLLKRRLGDFKRIRETFDGLNLEKAKEGDTALFFYPLAGYSRYMMTTSFTYLCAGYDVMLTDLRGFGKSEGTPYAEGTRMDTETMVEAAHKWGAKRIVTHGRCMGAFHALYGANYAVKRGLEVQGCLIDRHASSPGRVLTQEGAIWPLARPADYVYPYDSAAEIEASTFPLGMIRGTKDEFVDNSHTEIAMEAVRKSRDAEAKEEDHVLDLELDHGDEWWKTTADLKAFFTFRKKIFGV